jgi:hypothetical protein
VVVWLCGCVGGVVGVVGVGWFPLAFEHSKVCTLCDFGHLQFLVVTLLAQFLKK